MSATDRSQDRRGRRLPHLVVRFHKCALWRFFKHGRQTIAHVGSQPSGQRADGLQRTLASVLSSEAIASPVSISRRTPRSVSTGRRSRNSASVASSGARSMSVTAASRTDASGFDKPNFATVVLSTRLSRCSSRSSSGHLWTRNRHPPATGDRSIPTPGALSFVLTINVLILLRKYRRSSSNAVSTTRVRVARGLSRSTRLPCREARLAELPRAGQKSLVRCLSETAGRANISTRRAAATAATARRRVRHL